MARIRTIKPEFFTSEDIVSLSPVARLLYIALWCEADREGRFAWRPATFKHRYFPADKLNMDACSRELIDQGLVIPYGAGLAYIPKFSQHQRVNPREAKSELAAPPENAITNLDLHTSNLDSHAQGGREGKEGKGKEGVEHSRSRGSRLPTAWQPTELLKAWASKERPDLDLDATVAKFTDYWTAIPGSKGVKADWDATFRNFVRSEYAPRAGVVAVPAKPKVCAYCSNRATGSANGYQHCSEHQQPALYNETPPRRVAL